MLEKAYEAKKYEESIYKKWEKTKVFTPKIDPKKEPFTISMPPPNATGTLHLGHATMLAIEDIMTRYKRMQGYSALWVPGTDHASIATQNKVEKLIAEEGLDRHKMGRRAFLKRVNEFVENSRDTIRNQIRKMGSSCDWTRERYTLDKGLSHAVKEIFVKMYCDGLIYRGNRIVNWCPRCESTLADDEVEHKELEGNFYHIKYPLKGADGHITVATTRPETMLGDTAVAINPNDKRYKNLIGKTVILPIMGRKIPIIADKYVDMETGTGALKVTPAHDPYDFELYEKHKINIINILNNDGTLNKNAGKYKDQDRFEAREHIINKLKEQKLLTKIEKHIHSVGHCYRCETIIEPLTSKQWFIDVNKPIIPARPAGGKDGKKKKTIKEKSIEVVKKGEIKIIPKRFNKTYFHWMENLRDWCISRQIWFGHRIPVYYCKECEEIIVSTKKPEKCPKCKNKKLIQDPDTLDTWFSSGLWTFSTLGWPKKTKDLKYFHPTTVLETGYDILFFWIARMIIMTTYALNEIPFKYVYLHGLIRDKYGEKMSKSKPETCIDPLDMIEKYGTDALRLSFIIGATPGNDIRLYEEKIASFRNFINKIWNACRCVFLNLEPKDFKNDKINLKNLTVSDKWILSRTQTIISKTTKDLEKFCFSKAGERLYDFIWGEFCDWYIETSKIHKNPEVLLYILKTILKLLHPFVPFVTEVVWSNLPEKKMLISENWPKEDKKLKFTKEEKEFQTIIEITKAIRSVRAESKVDATKKIAAHIYGHNFTKIIKENKDIIIRLANLGELKIQEKGPKIKKAISKFVNKIEIYLPLEGLIDIKKEKERLEKELENTQNFLNSLKDKLKNQGFIKNAPKELISKEKNRLKQTEEQVKKIKGRLNLII